MFYTIGVWNIASQLTKQGKTISQKLSHNLSASRWLGKIISENYSYFGQIRNNNFIKFYSGWYFTLYKVSYKFLGSELVATHYVLSYHKNHWGLGSIDKKLSSLFLLMDCWQTTFIIIKIPSKFKWKIHAPLYFKFWR